MLSGKPAHKMQEISTPRLYPAVRHESLPISRISAKVPPKRIYLSPPHIGEYELKFVEEAFKTNWIAPLGPNTDAFEQEMAEYVGSAGALALCSGTAAIHLALRYLHVSRDDLVLCSSLTFIGSANPIMYQGAEPVFIDCEPETWNMSPLALERALRELKKEGKTPKAVVIVHLYGQSADMSPLLALCRQYQVPVLEDAAESLGATYKGKQSGTLGTFGVFSFNGNKILTTSGGGMLISNDLEALNKMRFWSTQSRDQAVHYQHSEMGYNYRLSNVLAGIGRGQLRVLDSHIRACRAIFKRYEQAFSDLEGVEFMPEASYGRSNRWLTTLTIDPTRCRTNANEIIHALTDENIESRPVWKPLHLQPIFENCRYYSHKINHTVSDKLFRQGICLPSGSNLSEEEQGRIIRCIRRLFRG